MSNAFPDRLASLDVAALRASYLAQNEFIFIEKFLTEDILAELTQKIDDLMPLIHRSFIPGHKKGGSVSRYYLDRYAPAFEAFYGNSTFIEFLGAITEAELKSCPPSDPHTYALYCYTEPGDHIGYHYDTSYYNGARYTVLVGLIDESHCRLEYELFRDDPKRETTSGSIQLTPGSLVLFNGDNVYHRITPAQEGDKRIALTLEYVTDPSMQPFKRFVSNMKDAIAYFGFRQVFARR